MVDPKRLIDSMKLCRRVNVIKVMKQTEWERDVALDQLGQIGKGLGEKMDDIVELLKKQEPVDPIEMIDDFYPIGDPLRTIGWRCGLCGDRIAGYDNFCPNCGQAVKWDE